LAAESMVEEAPPQNEGSNGANKAKVGVVVVIAVRLRIVVGFAIVLRIACTALALEHLVGMAKPSEITTKIPSNSDVNSKA
jgi:hypothetical protein